MRNTFVLTIFQQFKLKQFNEDSQLLLSYLPMADKTGKHVKSDFRYYEAVSRDIALQKAIALFY